MSHHLDTPLASQNGQLYIDDLYVFGDEGATVFILNVNTTVTGKDVKPGFHPEARYEFKVHLDDAPLESLTYRVSFDNPDGKGQQDFRVHLLSGADATSDSAEGELVVEGHTNGATGGGDYRVWAGQISDSFYVDLSLLAKVDAALKDGIALDLSSWNPAEAQNTFSGTTVESIVLAVSHDNLMLRPGTAIGVWGTTKLATDAGGWRQINRAGHPMIWPIFWPDDVHFANPANVRHPSDDVAAIEGYVSEKVAAVVAARGSSNDPQAYGRSVANILLPDVLGYVVGTAALYGFAGFNGRSMGDNTPEVMMSLVTGTAVPSGLTESVSRQFRDRTFPYVVPTNLNID